MRLSAIVPLPATLLKPSVSSTTGLFPRIKALTADDWSGRAWIKTTSASERSTMVKASVRMQNWITRRRRLLSTAQQPILAPKERH
eukprot:scaffold290614_cov31-Tisochrysis_lutea.AAC.5